MIMTRPLRKLTLTVHVIASVGWVGALAVFLAHAVASLISRDEQVVRAASLAMDVTAWFVILPLSLAALTTGLVQGLGTKWGLFRHYWVLFKLLLTAAATTVLLLKLGPIDRLADAATEPTFPGADLIGLPASLLVHAAGGLLVLVAATVLAIYKPAGMTRYGARKAREHDSAGAEPGLEQVTTTPLWVKVFGAIVILLMLLVSVMLLGGNHGPGAHL